jgi:hypothetical protein
MIEIMLKVHKSKGFYMVCFTFAPCKTIARQIYFLCRNDIVYLFVKKHFHPGLIMLNKVMLYKSATCLCRQAGANKVE